MFEFFCQEAAYLAEWGQLELVFLEHRGQPIAFNYGWNSKGVHFTPKVGYDGAYAKFGPGQRLMMGLLQHLHDDPQSWLLDFHRPLALWTKSWATCTYLVGLMIPTTDHPFSKCCFTSILTCNSACSSSARNCHHPHIRST